MKASDVIVIGGGINGMMSARKLVMAGCSVTLLERGRCAREASWAGGGILTPLYPWRYSDPVFRLDTLAATQWPTLAEELAASTGIDPEYSPHGVLHVRVEDADIACAWATRHQVALQALEDASARDCLGGMTTASLFPSFWLPERGSIRTPRLGKALRQWLIDQPNVDLVEHCEVNALTVAGNGISGVSTASGHYLAPQIVIAGGPWSREIALSQGISLPITPIRGQMLLFEADRPLLKSVMLMNGFYLIPRRDHRILAGSTFEDAGFDCSTTRDGFSRIHAQAVAMLPALADVHVSHHWAGLRPGSPESIPMVGPVNGLEGLYINAGHGGNGVVLSPATADLLGALMLGTSAPLAPAPYAPGRMAAECQN